MEQPVDLVVLAGKLVGVDRVQTEADRVTVEHAEALDLEASIVGQFANADDGRRKRLLSGAAHAATFDCNQASTDAAL
jgi:hypothetical protein